MNDTIRDYFKRRVRWCMAFGMGGFLVFASGGIVGPENPLFTLAGFVVVGGAMLATQWIKCPRCSARLGHIVMTLAVPWIKPQPNYCPYCGVSLDAPRARQTPAGPPPPINPIS